MFASARSWGRCTRAPIFARTYREAIEQLLRRVSVDHEYWGMP